MNSNKKKYCAVSSYTAHLHNLLIFKS